MERRARTRREPLLARSAGPAGDAASRFIDRPLIGFISCNRSSVRKPCHDGQADGHRQPVWQSAAPCWNGQRRREHSGIPHNVSNAKRRQPHAVSQHQSDDRQHTASKRREQSGAEDLRWRQPARCSSKELDVTRAEHSQGVERDPEREAQDEPDQCARQPNGRGLRQQTVRNAAQREREDETIGNATRPHVGNTATTSAPTYRTPPSIRAGEWAKSVTGYEVGDIR